MKPPKKLLHAFGRWLGTLPPEERARAVCRILSASAKHSSAEDTMIFLLQLDNLLYQMEGKASVVHGNGVHSKHRHINYHDYFIRHIPPGKRVLDIGCGEGTLTQDVARRVPGVTVTGIEICEERIESARSRYDLSNLVFIHGDALEQLPAGDYDVVVLSNVLEHIEHRVDFLKTILLTVRPERVILRVPLYERDWRVPLKEELGIDYRLDHTHFIEYTRETFLNELGEADLKVIHMEVRWGEIWCVAEEDRG